MMALHHYLADLFLRILMQKAQVPHSKRSIQSMRFGLMAGAAFLWQIVPLILAHKTNCLLCRLMWQHGIVCRKEF
jgi:hypothetical protein